jgi:tetratricopeptide (TPR) repeat protein
MPEHYTAKIYRAFLPFVRDGSEASARAAGETLEHTTQSPWSYIHGWQAMISIGEFDRAARFVSVPERVWGQWYSYPQSLMLGWTYRLEGREGAREQFTIAARQLEDEVAATPEDARLHTSLGIAYAGLGRSEEAVASALRGVKLMPIDKDVFVGCWLLQDLAWVYVMTGHPDAAVDAFDRILSMPSIFSIELLLADPRIDPLREHPGFLALVEKHKRS